MNPGPSRGLEVTASGSLTDKRNTWKVPVSLLESVGGGRAQPLPPSVPPPTPPLLHRLPPLLLWNRHRAH